jgi:hypothetical protein
VTLAGPNPRASVRVGSLRPNALLYSDGIGALVDLPHLSVIVKGLEYWDYRDADVRDLTEPRLLQRVRQLVGSHVRHLRPPPFKDVGATGDTAEADRVGIPVAPFPRWMRCTRCNLLAGLSADGDRPFRLENRNRHRPDEARFVHPECPSLLPGTRSRKPPTVIPARFVIVCRDGHLDDFPYQEYTHNGTTCARGAEGRLRMQDPGSSVGSQVTLSCSCGARRTMRDALRHHRMPERGFLPDCRGRHPHLMLFEEGCPEPTRAMVLGASNQWFGLVESALYIPSATGELEAAVERSWRHLRDATDEGILRYALQNHPDLRELRQAHPFEDIWAEVERHRRQEEEALPAEPVDLLAREYEVLVDPDSARDDPDFSADTMAAPSPWADLLERVVRVGRLRETRAMIGFTRVDAPEWGQAEIGRRAPISRGRVDWVPAATTHGEGIFLVLRGEVVRAWEERAAQSERLEALRAAFARWRTNRNLDGDPEQRWPGDRYVLLHTLSHLLVREIALECGYSSASIRERIYAKRDPDQVGILLYTAATDSEGTLGGVARLSAPRELERILDAAFQNAERCSSDPLCAEHVPLATEDTLHAAACHACLFASETTCENGNRFLDRGLLVQLDPTDGAALQTILGPRLR